MAENKNRKSKRAFNMEKHSNRHFDLEKEEAIVAPSIATPTSNSPSKNTTGSTTKAINNTAEDTRDNLDNGGNGGSKKSWIVLLVVVVAVMAFFGYKSCGNSSSEPKQEVPTDTTLNSQTDTTDLQSETTPSETTDTPSNSDADSNNEMQDEAVPSGKETATPAPNESGKPASTAVANTQSNELSVKDKAMQVWDGVYGDGDERKEKLGSDYKTVQRYVNKMYREGYRH